VAEQAEELCLIASEVALLSRALVCHHCRSGHEKLD
jgi:hypothetical protein